jgi:hypothetical protein
MKILSVTLGLVLVGAVQAEEIRWSKNFEAGMAKAKATKHLAMIDFYTDW